MLLYFVEPLFISSPILIQQNVIFIDSLSLLWLFSQFSSQDLNIENTTKQTLCKSPAIQRQQTKRWNAVGEPRPIDKPSIHAKVLRRKTQANLAKPSVVQHQRPRSGRRPRAHPLPHGPPRGPSHGAGAREAQGDLRPRAPATGVDLRRARTARVD